MEMSGDGAFMLNYSAKNFYDKKSFASHGEQNNRKKFETFLSSLPSSSRFFFKILHSNV